MISKRKTCGGKYVSSISLSSGIDRQMLQNLKEIGFQVDNSYAKLGMLKISKDNVTITGSFSNKLVSLTCSNIDDDICDKNIKTIINTIENFLRTFKFK
jgi:hypothetical protein